MSAYSLSTNAFTLLIVALSTLSINTQIRLEEDFLLKEFGDKWRITEGQ